MNLLSIREPVVSPDRKRLLLGVRFERYPLAVTWSPSSQCYPEVWTRRRIGAFAGIWPVDVDQERLAEAEWLNDRVVAFVAEGTTQVQFLADTETGEVTRAESDR